MINSICATPDGGVAIAGSVYNFDYQNYKYDGYILKLDSLQFVGVKDVKLSNKINNVVIYPNPVKDQLNIHSDIIPFSFKIYDIMGKSLIYRMMDRRDVQLDMKYLPSGIYCWRAENQELYENGIVIKQ